MRFLVDAHLPRSLCAVLARQGHNAIHTLDLPTGNLEEASVGCVPRATSLREGA